MSSSKDVIEYCGVEGNIVSNALFGGERNCYYAGDCVTNPVFSSKHL